MPGRQIRIEKGARDMSERERLMECLNNVATTIEDRVKASKLDVSPDWLDRCQRVIVRLLVQVDKGDTRLHGKTADDLARMVFKAAKGKEAMKDHRKRKTEQKHHKRLVSTFEASTQSFVERRESTEASVQTMQAREACLDELDEQNRRIFFAVYRDEKDRGEVCREEGITDEALRKRLSRICAQVRKCMARRGVQNDDLALVFASE